MHSVPIIALDVYEGAWFFVIAQHGCFGEAAHVFLFTEVRCDEHGVIFVEYNVRKQRFISLGMQQTLDPPPNVLKREKRKVGTLKCLPMA